MEPTKDLHFATMPTALVEPCLKLGAGDFGACAACGTPRERVVEKTREFLSGSGRSGNDPEGKNGTGMQGGGTTRDVHRGTVVHSKTLGSRPGCECDDVDMTQPLVLDPFAGSGTVLKVARKLGLRAIGIELNPDYCAIASKRVFDGDDDVTVAAKTKDFDAKWGGV